ncbi:MAG: hypothetical protein ABR576_13210 [Thermoanaerobaculia bacterium]
MSPLTVGVTGHRPNRLADASPRLLRDRVREVLGFLRGTRPEGAVPTLLTGLAEGADRIVAQEALELGFRVEAILPFVRSEYEKDFAGPASLQEFGQLLSRSGEVHELPGARRTPEAQDAAYAAVGRFILDRTNVLLAVWDGRRGRGLGGTTQVLLEALQRGTPVVWIAAGDPHDASVLLGNQDIPFPAGGEAIRAALEAARALPKRS